MVHWNQQKILRRIGLQFTPIVYDLLTLFTFMCKLLSHKIIFRISFEIHFHSLTTESLDYSRSFNRINFNRECGIRPKIDVGISPKIEDGIRPKTDFV